MDDYFVPESRCGWLHGLVRETRRNYRKREHTRINRTQRGMRFSTFAEWRVRLTGQPRRRTVVGRFSKTRMS